MGIDAAVGDGLPTHGYVISEKVLGETVIVSMVVLYTHPIGGAVCLKLALALQGLLGRGGLLEMYVRLTTEVIHENCGAPAPLCS
jgi:hypothetical protein